MLVKRYVVKEMPEAMAMIRQDLGKDAVILSTKKVQSRGFLGLFAKSHIEVVAAANETEPKLDRPVAAVSRPAAMGAYQQTKSSTTAAPTPPRVTVPPAAMQTFAGQEQVVPTQAPPTMQPPVPQQNSAFSAHLADVVARTQDLPLSKQPEERTGVLQATAVQEQPTVADDTVLKEVQELRVLLRSLVHSSAHQMLPEGVTNVRKQLLASDVDVEYVDELIEKGIRQFQQIPSIDMQEFRGILLNFIKEGLVEVAEPQPIALSTRVASFMGPTGVGKTTTIAKLAAEQVLKFGKKVGMITTDTYRIAAVDQLRTYANILNVPLEVCYSPEDVNRAMEKFADRDLILVDTAGRNYYNDLNVRELNAYLQVLKPDETFLVLSLTSKASDLDQITQNFVHVKIDKFLFTKSDETKTYGSIYNLVKRYKIPLSYLTTGQNVPDDIVVVSADQVASLIVGERSNV